MMNTPKLLPWLARRAGMPNEQVELLWLKALRRSAQAAPNSLEPVRMAAAMQDLLAMLGMVDCAAFAAALPQPGAGRHHRTGHSGAASAARLLQEPDSCVAA